MVATSVLFLVFAFQTAGPIELHPHVAATARAGAIPRADLSVDVPLVLIPVHVTTPLGASVTNLAKSSFHLFEDGIEQKISHFASDDAPLSVGFLFDASGSMRNKLRKSAQAAEAFFKTANAEDEFFLIEFNDRPRLAIPFTQNAEAIYRRIAHTHAVGRTSLLDAIHMALVQMRNAKNLRKAIVIVSDGGDNRSRFTETEIKSAMREADVQVYAMGIFDTEDSPKRPLEERNGPKLLDDLAEETGGRHYPVKDLDQLPTVCERIGNELRSEYLIGYAPTNDQQDGTYRKVKVTVSSPEGTPALRAHNRQGYYAPAMLGQ
jgi:Ca-activated chloride channel homolog